MTKLQAHPLAEKFLALTDEQYVSLRESIALVGQVTPIYTFDGKILDGRHRYKACLELGIEPKFYALPKGADPVFWVISLNVEGRKMTPSVAAMYASDPVFYAYYAARAHTRMSEGAKGEGVGKDSLPSKGQARDEAAASLGVSGRYVDMGRRIRKEAPEMVDKILAGEVSVIEVDRELKHRAAAKRVAKKGAKQDERKRQEEPREVAVFLEAMSAFYKATKEAVKVAQWGKFSPEAKKFTIRQLDQVSANIEELKEALQTDG